MNPIDFLPPGSYRVYGEDNKIIVRRMCGGFLNSPVALTEEQANVMSAEACCAILRKELGSKRLILHIENSSDGVITNRWTQFSS